ncbi:MAG TPA: hypothetical protein VLC12_04150 [Terriglobales bacterium]|nr:hypothetical protein [Terriglobales bacterium]
MTRSDNAVAFVTDWWELSSRLVTTLAAVRRLKAAYPADYLLTFCGSQDIAGGASALREICQYLESVAQLSAQAR